jgi:large subunit ribosomal protein L21
VPVRGRENRLASGAAARISERGRAAVRPEAALGRARGSADADRSPSSMPASAVWRMAASSAATRFSALRRLGSLCCHGAGPARPGSTLRPPAAAAKRYLSSDPSRPPSGRTAMSAAAAGPEHIPPPPRSSYPEPEIFPLPDGVDGSRVGLYEIVGSEGTANDGGGLRSIFGVHGPRQYWPGGGGSLEAAGGGCFAVVEVAGRQYKVTAGDTLYTNRIPGEVNTTITFDKVSLVGTMLWSVFGRPYVPDAAVRATVESQTRSAKVMVTKFKKRKGYRRRKGHRQPITRVHIDAVEYSAPDGDSLVPHEVPYDPLRPPMSNNPRLI